MSTTTTNTPAKRPAKLNGTASKSPSSSAQPLDVSAMAGDDALKAIERLEAKTKTVNSNNVARVANSHLKSNDEKLQPLMSLKTGKPIEKFPATSKDIEKLSLVDAMLNALEADRSGSEAMKKERFRVQVGLKPNPA